MANNSDIEFSEGVAEQRRILQEQGNTALKSIEIDLKELKEDGKRIGKQVAIIGSIFFGGYLIYRMLAPSESSKEEDQHEQPSVERKGPSFGHAVFSQLTGVASALLLEYARRRLIQYLDSLDEPETP